MEVEGDGNLMNLDVKINNGFYSIGERKMFYCVVIIVNMSSYLLSVSPIYDKLWL